MLRPFGQPSRASVPYLTFVRPSVGRTDENAVVVSHHEAAAVLSFADRKPVLLTTGSRNLEPYLREARRTGTQIVARVLDHPDSINACIGAGLRDDQLIVGRGPFSVNENRVTIRAHGIGALVTKDSGTAGGVHEKLEAAREERCKVVIVQRPLLSLYGAFGSVPSLIAEVICKVSPRFRGADSQ